jgi:hypothetical protein
MLPIFGNISGARKALIDNPEQRNIRYPVAPNIISAATVAIETLPKRAWLIFIFVRVEKARQGEPRLRQ